LSAPVKRGRGRPRKEAAPAEAVVAPAVVATTAPAPKARSKRKATADAIVVEDAASVPAAAADVAATSSRPAKRAKGSVKKAPSSKAAAGAASAAPTSVPTDGFKHGTLTRDFENSLLVARGLDLLSSSTFLFGVDEAGRGPLAGPVVCAAVHIPADVCIEGLHDSKLMSSEERERAFASLTTHPRVHFAISTIEHDEIDRINILEATLKGMTEATAALAAKLSSASASASKAVAAAGGPSSPVQPSLVLVDGNRLPKSILQPAEFVIKGDSKSYSIAGASILAKVTRDRLMDAHHATWPQYNFAQHKGYGVAAHMSAIWKHGPCPIHRRTFAPMKHMTPKSDASAADAAAAADASGAAAADVETTLGKRKSAGRKQK
jgi:ribonuclease HII